VASLRALMLVLLLASLDQTIVSTALRRSSAISARGRSCSWVRDGVPARVHRGRTAVRQARRPCTAQAILQFAIVLFLVGSVLCGLSRDMAELIAFRACRPRRRRPVVVTFRWSATSCHPGTGRYQGLFGACSVSTVWGRCSAGSSSTRVLAVIFYVNLPIGALALAVIAVTFHARPSTSTEHRLSGHRGADRRAWEPCLYSSLGARPTAGARPDGRHGRGGVVLLVVFPFVENRGRRADPADADLPQRCSP